MLTGCGWVQSTRDSLATSSNAKDDHPLQPRNFTLQGPCLGKWSGTSSINIIWELNTCRISSPISKLQIISIFMRLWEDEGGHE